MAGDHAQIGEGEVKEHGILFSAPMVRSILAGTKTQTRRIAKAPKGHRVGSLDSIAGAMMVVREDDPTRGRLVHAPHGPVGRRLWVRETWAPWGEHLESHGEAHVIEDARRQMPWASIVRRADANGGHVDVKRWKPAIHMPRWASRIALEVTRVRLERVQSITEYDARAEGVDTGPTVGEVYRLADGRVDARSVYADLWDTINGKGSWASNPWCWAYDFKRIA
jgi:hypothetical protein